ncbi:hypothetical protein Ctob_002709 [Chrysochromulina tobinii]|uniref:Uncharacterized protein n=1 Tax=Chrysochromulina tobinii TaxID=1460289 RepID=A0A0M0JWR3_9EUKA|nr:hypothetical protein Ctob_002709 [Chrysochromulina tobinii]|eukprot:KOO30767.1 hypothetical protein Ctob_002709 [Chrysochromulina sp. CCMP291]
MSGRLIPARICWMMSGQPSCKLPMMASVCRWPQRIMIEATWVLACSGYLRTKYLKTPTSSTRSSTMPAMPPAMPKISSGVGQRTQPRPSSSTS